MSTSYIPASDDQFNEMSAAFTNWVAENGTTHGVPNTLVNGLVDAQGAWNTAWTAFGDAENAYHTATQTKDAARAALEAQIRPDAAMIQKNPATTDADRVAAHITVPKAGPTPAPVPSTSPTMQKIDTASRGILRLFYADSATPDRSAKPAGVAFAEIRQQIGGTAPTNLDAMPLLGMSGRTPYRADFAPENIGQTVYFALRWINTRGETGPWSEVFSAVVPS